MTRRIVITCDRCKKEDNIGWRILFPDDSGRNEELEVCGDCWCSFHSWRWRRNEKTRD
jgi:hypothetical protein